MISAKIEEKLLQKHSSTIYDPKLQKTILPVVPHKAVAEVSKIGNL